MIEEIDISKGVNTGFELAEKINEIIDVINKTDKDSSISLADKFANVQLLNKSVAEWSKEMAQIAEKHYLELFDKICKEEEMTLSNLGSIPPTTIKTIRKELEKA